MMAGVVSESPEREPILSDADAGHPVESHLDEEIVLDSETDVHIASEAEKKFFWWRNALINSLFILTWYIFATVISLSNKWMFSPEHFGFPYPLFATTIHMFIQFSLSAFLRCTFPRIFASDRKPTPRNYCTKVVPPAVATGLDIGLSNVSLKTITLSFYTMCKSSSLIFVLFFAFLFRLESFSVRLVAVILIIFAGVLLMVASETAFELSGFLLVMFASICGGLRWSLTQVAMQDRFLGLDNPPSTIYWMSPTTAISIALISIFWEGWIQVFSSSFFATAASVFMTLLLFVAVGIAAFFMVMSEYYIIQRAGVLPMSIAGIAKEVSTITIAAWFFGDELTPVNITGVAITISGIALFTYHKYRRTVDSKVTLDAHGNVIQLDGEISNGGGSVYRHDVELVASSHETTPIHPSIQEDGNGDVYQHLLFSGEGLDEGEEDAEEIRSLKSSKLDWKGETNKTRKSVGMDYH